MLTVTPGAQPAVQAAKILIFNIPANPYNKIYLTAASMARAACRGLGGSRHAAA